MNLGWLANSPPPPIDAETYFSEPILREETHDVEEEAGSFSPELLHGDEDEEAIDPEEDEATLERSSKDMQQALASKPTPLEDNLELKAMKAMGAMEEGDAIFGFGFEVNLDSQSFGGMRNTDLESKSISIVYTLDTSGTNTIKPTTIMTINLPRL